jgi:hypothetical protein
MFQNTNDMSCATALLKVSWKVSRFDGTYFAGQVSIKGHAASVLSSEYYVLKETELFSATLKNFFKCVRHHMLLEGNLHNHYKYNKFQIHYH